MRRVTVDRVERGKEKEGSGFHRNASLSIFYYRMRARAFKSPLLTEQVGKVFLVPGHEFRNECLKVEDFLASPVEPCLIVSGVLDDVVLEGVVGVLHKLGREGAEDNGGGDAVG